MAADWTAKSHGDADRWLETQCSWWATVIGIDAATPDAAKAEAVEAWRQSTRSVVDAQADVLLSLLSEPADDAEQLLRRWTDTQRELLYGWLAVSGGSGKPDVPPMGCAGQSVPDAGQQMLESLRKAARSVDRQACVEQPERDRPLTRAVPRELGRYPTRLDLLASTRPRTAPMSEIDCP